MAPLRVLISGASVAGPMAAYWLARYGFAVTVVERMPQARVRTSGHAVDLFGPAMDVAEWAGVLPAVMDARTQTDIVSFQRDGGRSVDVEMRRMVAGVSGRHAEVMRGELANILYEATRNEATYLFDDSIRTMVEEPDGVTVTFERAPSDRFDLVIGADGLHSNVRRLIFGPEARFRRFLGGYLAVPPCPITSASTAGWWSGTLLGDWRRSSPSAGRRQPEEAFCSAATKSSHSTTATWGPRNKRYIVSTETMGGRFLGCWPSSMRPTTSTSTPSARS